MSFVSPWFLLGFAAIAIPIYLHLYFQKKPILKNFPSLRLIRKSVEHLARRKKIRNYILMALRIAIIFFSVLALARPYWGGNAAVANSSQAPTAFVVLLDTSMSMSSTSQGVSAFNTGRSKALEILDQMTENDRATVGFINNPGGLYFSQLTWDKDNLKRIISDASVNIGNTNLNDAIMPAIKILEPLKDYKRMVFVITDMTETSWKPFLRNFEPDKIDKNIDLILVPTVNENINNTAITELSVNEPAIIVGKETNVKVKLSNYSEKTSRLRIALAVNDETKMDKELELEANSEKETDFKIIFQKKGMNKLAASINGDSLSADNKRYEAVRVFEPYKILIIKPENSANKVNNEDLFIKFALNPLNRNKNNIFITESRTPSELNNLNINLYSAVIIINQRHLNKDFIKQLSNYVISGGSLITFLGDKTEPEWYNKNFNQDLGENYILPAKLFKRVGNAVSRSSFYNMTDINYDHLAFKALKNENSGINSARIYEFFQIRPNERSLLLCKMNHGFPGIVEEKRGNGRSMLVTFSPDTMWSNWPAKPSWLPFLHGSLIYMVTANELTINNMRSGMAISENIPYAFSDEIIMKLPNGENGRLSKIVVNDNLININSKDTEQAGYYEIIANNKTITAFAVNPSKEESNLKRIPVKEIPRFAIMNNEIGNGTVEEKINALKSGYDLSMLFMVLLIVIALLEHWLANISTEKRTV